MTSVKLSIRFTLIARHSRLCSSKMLSVLNDEALSAIGLRTIGECHHPCDGARSHTTRRDCDKQDVNGHTIHR